jgi:alkylation response protein AidB-like acyl-CoA dehydrogenase
VPVAGDGDGAALAVVPADGAGVSTRRLPGFLAFNDEVTFDNAPVEPDILQVGADDGRTALGRAYVLLAAYTVGGCQVLLERCVDYSSTRFQFAQAIGRFQRVQDHIVEIANALDATRWVTYDALWRMDSGKDFLARAHMAKAVAAESYISCTDYAHKVHGGIGVDPDYGLTLYTQQARSLYSYLGAPRWHKRQMTEALGSASGTTEPEDSISA